MKARKHRSSYRTASLQRIRPVEHQIRADVCLEEITDWLDPAPRHRGTFEEHGIQCLSEARAYVDRGAKLIKPSNPLAT